MTDIKPKCVPEKSYLVRRLAVTELQRLDYLEIRVPSEALVRTQGMATVVYAGKLLFHASLDDNNHQRYRYEPENDVLTPENDLEVWFEVIAGERNVEAEFGVSRVG